MAPTQSPEKAKEIAEALSNTDGIIFHLWPMRAKVPNGDVTGLVLQGATCQMQAVAPGTYIRVKVFDPKTNRYLLESADGGCGWIRAD